MKLKRRCTLCGGRLDHTLRCTECGLDNTKNDSMYKNMINKNDCEDQPLTHVHEHKEMKYSAPKTQPYKPAKTQTYRNTNTKKKKKGGCLSTLIVFIMMFSMAVPFVRGVIEELDFSEIEIEGFDPEEIIHGRNYQEYYLTPGIYQIGLDLAEGTYEILSANDTDGMVDIYYFDGHEFWFEEGWYGDSDWSIEVDLMYGQYVIVQEGDMIFQTYAYEVYEDSVYIGSIGPAEAYPISGTMVAGVDFPEGVYKIDFTECDPDIWSEVDIQLLSENGHDEMLGLYLYYEGEFDEFVNVPFTQGSQITVPSELEGVYLIPNDYVSQEMYDLIWE